MKKHIHGRGRGFAALSIERRRELASMGGKAAHAMGRAHKWTGGPDGTAADAGRKGGRISRRSSGRKTA